LPNSAQPAAPNARSAENLLEQHERETLILELNQNGRAMGDAFRKNSAFIEECEKRSREIDLELQNLQRADAALKLQQRLLDGKKVEIEGINRELEEWSQENVCHCWQVCNKNCRRMTLRMPSAKN